MTDRSEKQELRKISGTVANNAALSLGIKNRDTAASVYSDKLPDSIPAFTIMNQKGIPSKA